MIIRYQVAGPLGMKPLRVSFGHSEMFVVLF